MRSVVARLSADIDAAYGYDTEGRMNSVTYPTTYDQGDGNSPSAINPRAMAGPVYVTSYDALGRANGMTQNSTALVSNVQYGVAGELLQMTYQLQQYPYTNTTETRLYNNLFQLTNVASYGVSMQYSYPAAGANNGKVASQADAFTGETVTYGYDSLNRLISANSTIAGQSQTFGYDGFGNMTAKGSLSVNVDPGTNQLVATGLTYDGNGNMTFQPGMTGQYVYDAENRMTSAPGVQYGYDGQNKRNYKAVVNSGGFVTSEEFYFSGADGKKIGTYNLQQVAVGGPANLTLTFTGTGPGTLAYFRGRVLRPQDRLGSFGTYYSYGEEKGSNGPNDNLKFATYTRDAATLLDYADQRYYSSQFGRFMSADPYMASGGAGDPGSWNRYAYTRGDPVNRFDPQGLADFSVTGYCSGCKNDGFPGQYGGDAMEMDRSGEGTEGGLTQQGGADSGTTFASAQRAFQSDAKKIAKKKKFKQPCDDDFALLGTNADAVRTGAANAVFLNGVGSTVLMASLYASSPVPGVRQAGNSVTGTVGSYIASKPGTVAVAQLGGSNIYLNAGLIDPNNYFQDISIVLHELLHNVTGLTDVDIQRRLGVSISDISNNITQKLLKDCF